MLPAEKKDTPVLIVPIVTYRKDYLITWKFLSAINRFNQTILYNLYILLQ